MAGQHHCDYAPFTHKDLVRKLRVLHALRSPDQETYASKVECQAPLESQRYHAVLIDGNAMVFHRGLLRKGFRGGLRAARRIFDIFSGETVFISVYLDVDVQAQILVNNGVISEKATLVEFFRGFADPQNKYADVINIAAATEKLSQRFEWYVGRIPECKSVLLGGGSNEKEYRRLLNRHILKYSDRIRLLHRSPFEPQILDGITRYSLAVARIDGLFEPEGATAEASDCPLNPAATTFVPRENSPKNTYAAQGRLSPLMAAQIPPSISQSAREREADRYVESLQPPPCNNHYLKSKGCPLGDSCFYSHHHFIQDPEREAMRRRARNSWCSYGKDCYNEECYYNHPSSHPLHFPRFRGKVFYV